MKTENRSESRHSEKSRPPSEFAQESQQVESSRPTSQAAKSRPISQNEEHSRPESQINAASRPNSKMVEFADEDESERNEKDFNSKTRPNSEINRPKSEIKSRPESEMKSNTRPNSKMENPISESSSKASTRPNSQIVGDDSFSNKPKSRPSTRSISKNEDNRGPIIDEEGVIEGIVNGEDEVERMNNEGINEPRSNELITESVQGDDDIAHLVASGNMEKMAALVLNGHGQKLIGQHSDNPELQSFLENVPIYMVRLLNFNINILRNLF